MLSILGLILALIGILGLVGLVPIGLAVEIVLIVAGLLLIAFDRGAFTRV